MFVDPLYWVFESELPNRLCDQIIEEGKKMSPSEGVAGDKVDKSVRDSGVCFFRNPSWVGGLCEHYVRVANRSSDWNFDLKVVQDPQFTIYESGQHYTWHQDVIGKGNVRKLSMVIQLTDPNEYEGGKLELKNNVGEEVVCQDFMARGSVIVFPSVTWHRVTPITKGRRYSAVAWAVGPEFK